MFPFSGRTLREKILVGFFVVIIMMLVVTSWGIYNFFEISSSFKKTMSQNYKSIIASDNMGLAVEDQLHSVIVIFKQNVQEGLSQFEVLKEKFYLYYKQTADAAITKEEEAVLDSVNHQYNDFVESIYGIDFENLEKKKESYAEDYFIQSIETVRLIKKRCYEIFKINHASLNQSIMQIDEQTRTATILMLIIVVIGIAMTFLFIFKFSNYLVTPILEFTKSVRHISEGHFNENIDVSTEDEIGTLANEFNKMSKRLYEYEKLNVSKILYEKRKADVIIENINEPIVFTDAELKIITANKTFRKVFGEHSEPGTSLNSIISTNGLIKEFNATIRNSNFGIREDSLEYLDEINNKKYFKLIYSLIELPESDLKGLIIVFNDVTKFQELDLMKTEFIGKVSHELKTPLTSIGMAIGMFENEVTGKINKKQGSLIATMKSDYTRLSKLVNEILELTKIEAKKKQLEFNKFEIAEMIHDVKERVSLQCKEKNLELDVEIPNSIILINGNFEYLSRALENIISNSIKFTEPAGKISIKLSKGNNFALIEIIDTGKGINPKDIGKIFDKFAQIERNLPGSVGLGLSIAKEIVEIHKGFIEVASQPGHGSKFTIKLPAL